MIKVQRLLSSMRNLLFLLLLLVTSLGASEVEVISGEVTLDGPILKASGDVVVFYDDMMLRAKKMTYDKDSKLLDMWGDVYIMKGALYYALGEELHIDINNKTRTYKPLYIHEKKNFMWLSAPSATSVDGVYELKDALISSCNPNNPEWRMGYTTGRYDSKEKWVDLYNMVLYAGDVPFIYLPYFGFTTDDTRTTGFLRPSIGWSELEGFFFEQPFYVVFSDQADLEIRYQSRSRRGEAGYADLRFVDSPTSKGKISLGYFKEENNNQTKFGWVNNAHYGAEIDYTRTHMIDRFLGEGDSDQIYMDINLYNDIDYVNLKLQNGERPNTSNIITSKINYALGGDRQYLGIYNKFFIDTVKLSNAQTLQELPNVQYHKYLDTFIFDHLTYSLDYANTYRYRSELANANEDLVTIPLSYTLPLFHNYVNFGINENIAMSSISFSNTGGDSRFESGDYVSSSQEFVLDTDLIKRYKKSIHALRTGISYETPGFEYKSGFYENKYGQFDKQSCQVGDPCEFAQGSINPIENKLSLNLTQYFYDLKGQEWLYHKISQPFYVDRNESSGTLENEFRVTFNNHVSFYNDIKLNTNLGRLDLSSSSIGYNGLDVKTVLTHLYQNQPEISKESDYYTFSIDYHPNTRYTYYGQYAYDNLLESSRNWKIGVKMKKRCWSYELRYSENIVPTSTASLTDRFVYISLELIPIAGVDYEYNILHN